LHGKENLTKVRDSPEEVRESGGPENRRLEVAPLGAPPQTAGGGAAREPPGSCPPGPPQESPPPGLPSHPLSPPPKIGVQDPW
jgi:hypothetical protein